MIEELRSRIADHSIPPGSRIREQDLVREFKIARLRAREVLYGLESLGLVSLSPNSGAVVKRLELDQVFEIFDVREVLDGLCVRLATKNAPSEVWVKQLERFGPDLERKIRTGDIDAFDEAVMELRRTIIQYARNDVLSGMLDSVYERTLVIMRRVLILPGRVETAIEQQRIIIGHMIAGRAEEAEEARRANLRSAISELRKYQKFVL